MGAAKGRARGKCAVALIAIAGEVSRALALLLPLQGEKVGMRGPLRELGVCGGATELMVDILDRADCRQLVSLFGRRRPFLRPGRGSMGRRAQRSSGLAAGHRRRRRAAALTSASTAPGLCRRDDRLSWLWFAVWRLAQPRPGRGEATKPAGTIEQADVAVAEAHDVVLGFELGDADELTDQRFADEDLAAFPLDCAGRPHPTDLMMGIVPWLLDTIRHGALRGRIDLVRRPLPQRLMRTLFVVVAAEGIKTDLLRASVGGRWARGLRLERAMHALMAAVLLRRGRMNEMGLDAELEPPGRQACQAARSGRTERRPVVAADCPRQPEATKRPVKHGLRRLDPGEHDPHVDEKPAVAVGDRQGVDPLIVARPKPALEVHRPFVVCSCNRRHHSGLVERRPSPPDRGNQAGALENVPDRRGRRPARRRRVTLKHPKHLARPHMRKATAHCDDRLHHGRVRRVRTVQHGMRTIGKPCRVSAVASLAPLIKRVAANPVASAQFRNAPVAGIVIRQHPNTLFHPTGLLERHRKSSFRANLTCRPSTRSKLSGIYSVCTVPCPSPQPSPPKKGERERGHRARSSVWRKRMSSRCRIAIVGGGLAGLAAANAMRSFRIEPEVFEAAPALGEIGAAVNASPQAVKALRAAGVGDEIAAVGYASPGIYTRNMLTGEYLEFNDRFKAAERYGAPYYSFHRADLLDALASRLDHTKIHLGHRLTGLEERSDSTMLLFDNGARVEAEYV